MCCFYRGRSGLAPESLDIGRDRNRLDVFNVLVSSALNPGQELFNSPGKRQRL